MPYVVTGLMICLPGVLVVYFGDFDISGCDTEL
jgi:hypothetical protein